jgi:hypothetical protein
MLFFVTVFSPCGLQSCVFSGKNELWSKFSSLLSILFWKNFRWFHLCIHRAQRCKCSILPGMSGNNAIYYAVQHLLFQELTVVENGFQKPVSNSKRICHSEATMLNIPTACEQLLYSSKSRHQVVLFTPPVTNLYYYPNNTSIGSVCSKQPLQEQLLLAHL